MVRIHLYYTISDDRKNIELSPFAISHSGVTGQSGRKAEGTSTLRQLPCNIVDADAAAFVTTRKKESKGNFPIPALL